MFAVGVAIAVERYVTLTMITQKNQSSWEEIQPVLKRGDFDTARRMTKEDESTIGQLLNMGLVRQGAVRRCAPIQRRG